MAWKLHSTWGIPPTIILNYSEGHKWECHLRIDHRVREETVSRSACAGVMIAEQMEHPVCLDLYCSSVS